MYFGKILAKNDTILNFNLKTIEEAARAAAASPARSLPGLFASIFHDFRSNV